MRLVPREAEFRGYPIPSAVSQDKKEYARDTGYKHCFVLKKNTPKNGVVGSKLNPKRLGPGDV